MLTFDEEFDLLSGHHYESTDFEGEYAGRCICGNPWICIHWIYGYTDYVIEEVP